MSRPRYKWWSYVKWMIRLYPEREAELRRRQAAAVTPNYSPMPGGSGPSRTTEELGTVSLGRVVDREMEAVRRAIEETERMVTGEIRLKIIREVYWDKTHTLNGAFLDCHISQRTGERWHAEFVHLVAKNFELE